MLEDKEQIRERENHRVFKQLLGTFIEEETKEKEELEEYAKDIKIIPKINNSTKLKTLQNSIREC